MHHQDFSIRNIAAFKALGINSGYIGWRAPGGQVRLDLVMEFLRDEDPRIRRAMFGALLQRTDVLNPEMQELAVKAIRDPDESWWVKDAAIQIVGHNSADKIVPLVDLLIPYLKHEEAWLRNAALIALTPVAADERCYERLLPAMGELVRNNQRVSVTLGFAPAIRAEIKNASPAVQKLAAETLKETFAEYAGTKVAPGALNTTSTYDYHLEAIAASLADVPGGLDVVYEIARKKYPGEILPYKNLFLNAYSSSFGPELKQAIVPIIMDELIPEFVGKNRRRLIPLAAGEVQSQRPRGRGEPIDELASLYRRARDDQYDWKMFVDLRDAEWSYYSFDPIAAEQVPFDQLVSRYRKITLPRGMETWYQPEFDAANAGWKTGKSPFGNYDGAIPTRPITKCSTGCVGPGCYGATPVNTLWAKEVLLMRGTFKIPALKQGYRYRLRVNSGDHVGSGGGHMIYINGKPLVETKQGGGRGSGGLPKGAFITREFRDDFNSGEVTIAVKAFIRYNDKYSTKPSSRLPQGKISIHLAEQKLPPMNDELVFKSASTVPMLSSHWQDRINPEDASQDPNENLFRWDGKFVAHPDIPGSWQVISRVEDINDFDPVAKNAKARNAPFATITFNADGRTSYPNWAWSGNILMDLDRYQALEMQVKQIDEVEYLFLEAGGFSIRQKPGWESEWFVLRKM